MYYELYIDAFFMVNAIMSFFVLLVVKQWLRCTATRLRIALGSAIGALLTCIIVVIPIRGVLIKYLLIHLGVNSLTVWFGLNIKKRNLFLTAIVLSYLMTFLFGGMIQWFIEQSSIKIDVISIAIAGAGCCVTICIALRIFRRYDKKKSMLWNVTIKNKEKVKKLTGLADSGNSLIDPIGKKPVHIIPLEEAKGILPDEVCTFLTDYYQNKLPVDFENSSNVMTSISYVPFHSVGRKRGILPAFTADLMLLEKESEVIRIDQPKIAVCEDRFASRNRYQMIVNPKLTNH